MLEGLTLGRRVLALNLGGTPELLRYQQFAGQLQLFASLDELVGAIEDLPPSPAPPTIARNADVTTRLDDILAVYTTRAAASESSPREVTS